MIEHTLRLAAMNQHWTQRNLIGTLLQPGESVALMPEMEEEAASNFSRIGR